MKSLDTESELAALCSRSWQGVAVILDAMNWSQVGVHRLRDSQEEVEGHGRSKNPTDHGAQPSSLDDSMCGMTSIWLLTKIKADSNSHKTQVHVSMRIGLAKILHHSSYQSISVHSWKNSLQPLLWPVACPISSHKLIQCYLHINHSLGLMTKPLDHFPFIKRAKKKFSNLNYQLCHLSEWSCRWPTEVWHRWDGRQQVDVTSNQGVPAPLWEYTHVMHRLGCSVAKGNKRPMSLDALLIL